MIILLQKKNFGPNVIYDVFISHICHIGNFRRNFDGNLAGGTNANLSSFEQVTLVGGTKGNLR